MPERPIRILHAHSTFSLGGKEARAVRLMNAFGGVAEHSIWSAMPDQLSAREAIAPGIAVDFAEGAPPLAGTPTLPRLWRLARYMRRFDLVLSYNWGAMDAVMARRLFGLPLRLPPLVHHEDGFNEDEAERLNPLRTRYRRIALPAAHRLIVPSRGLEWVARNAWKRPPHRLERIGNGIPVGRYGGRPSVAIPGFERREGEVVVGTVAGLRKVKNLPLLVEVVAQLLDQQPVRLLIVGEGPEREAIAAAATRLRVANRVLMPGFLPDPYRYLGHFDIFALTSESEQFPIALVEAMAAGLPVVATDVGDVAEMVSTENRGFIERFEGLLWMKLEELVRDPALRARLGGANQHKARAEYDERDMISRYAALYGEAIGRPGAFGTVPQ